MNGLACLNTGSILIYSNTIDWGWPTQSPMGGTAIKIFRNVDKTGFIKSLFQGYWPREDQFH